MFVTELVSKFTGWLKLNAFLNIPLMSVTELVFQPLMSLKLWQESLNSSEKSVTRDTSHVLISP